MILLSDESKKRTKDVHIFISQWLAWGNVLFVSVI